MESNKGLLVPINYGGQWKKGGDGCWSYEALYTRYVRVTCSTTYQNLIDMICAETGITMEENIIEVKAWISFPVKTVMPPFIILRTSDILTFIELNDNRDIIIPLCISTSTKSNFLVSPTPPIAVEKAKVEAVQEHGISQMFNNSEIVPYCIQDNNDVRSTIGIDDIILTNPLSSYRDNEEGYHKLGDEVVADETCDDPFENHDPFEDVFDEYSNDKHDQFASVCDGVLDPYFGVFVKSNLAVHPEESAQPTKNEAVHCYTDENDVDYAQPTEKAADNDFEMSGNESHVITCVNDGHSEAQSTNINVHVLTDFHVGEILRSKAELLIRLRIITVKANREFQITHSDRRRLIATCVDNSCSWRIRGILSKKLGCWIIMRYVKDHSCSIDSRFKRKRGCATSQVIAQMVKDDNNDPWDIVKRLEKVYGIKITYWKAWKAKDIAKQLIRGSPESSFLGLPSYLWLLERENPGTYSAYQVDDNNSFVQCFLAFGPSIVGFQSSIRPVIAVDACFLKGRYRGKLFIATTMDGNKQIFPLAFGVAAAENDVHWSWFFQQLRNVVGDREDLVFISDRHPSIEKCCREHFPEATYGICMFHLGLNVNRKFKVRAEEFLYRVAKAYTEIDFEERLNKVRVAKKPVYDYLMEADPQKWARCYFPARRYSIMTTNIAESMNAVLNVAREFPIIAMLETIRSKLQEWFHDRLRVANSCTSLLTPYAEKKLGKRDDRSRHFSVYPIDEFRFQIIDGHRDATVDINRRTCTCYEFQLDQLPCGHAIRGARWRNISAYSLCSRYYTVDSLRTAYALPMNPVPHRSEWYRVVPQEVRDVVVRPPVIKNKKGRIQKKRIPSQGEETLSARRCGRCKEPGHNRQTCKGEEYVPPQEN